MAHQQTQLDKRIKQRFKALAGRGLKQRLEWLRLYPVGLELDATVAINRLAWTKLGALATKWRSPAERDVKAMVIQQREWSLLWGDLQTVRRKLQTTWRQPGSLPSWPVVRTRMLAEAGDRGLTQEQVQQHLAAFERASVDDVCRATERPVVWFGRQLDAAIVGRFSALAAAELADAVSRFNISVAKKTAVRPSRAIGRTSVVEARSLLRAVHAALKTGRRATVRAKAKAAGVRASKLLAPLVTAAAYDALHDPGGNDLSLGHHALEVGGGVRGVLLVSSAARVLGWIAGWPEDSPFFARWVKAAKATAFDPQATRIESTPLSDLGPASDGKRISVEGRVGPVTIVHLGQKAISSTFLTDASGAQIRIGLPYVNGGTIPS